MPQNQLGGEKNWGAPQLLVFDMSLKCMTRSAMRNFLQERGNLKKTEKREPDTMLHVAWRPLCVITERIDLAHRFSRPF